VKVEFAPDGIHMLTAVTFDRVKVDNEVKIFKANGQLVTDVSFRETELYEFIWQPRKPGTIKKPNLNLVLNEKTKKFEEDKNA
jgi:uncharacterized protein with WD repeat